jgi:hypothetical protein
LSTVKYLLLLSLGIALTSGYWYTRLSEDNSSLRDSVTTLENNKMKSQVTLDYLRQELTHDEVELPLDKSLASAMLDIYNMRTAHRVSIAQAKVANASGTSVAAEVVQFAEQVPGTQLKSVKVSLTGNYTDYDGFLTYIAELRAKHPVSLVFLKVDDLSFEMSIRVFGK